MRSKTFPVVRRGKRRNDYVIRERGNPMKLTRDLLKDFFGNGSKYLAPLILLGALASGATQNGSDGKSLRFTKKQLMVSPYESCAVGDLNRDGRPDIVYGAYWFAGPDFVPRAFRPNHVAQEYMRANS